MFQLKFIKNLDVIKHSFLPRDKKNKFEKERE